MDGSASVAQVAATSRVSTGRMVWIALAFLTAVVFWFLIALPYLTLTAETLFLYDGERGWILTHVGLGTVALLTGPVQLWLGSARSRMSLHRTLGKVYMGTVFLGALVALRLAFTPSAGLVFGVGLGVLAVAWVLTTGMAFLAIRRRQVGQHQDWMIRSYVVTFAFVFFRMIVGGMQVAGVGTQQEQVTTAAWLCWSLPLVLTEVVLQSRRTLGPVRAIRS